MLSRVTAFKRWFAVLAMFALATASRADIEILLQKEFIKKFKNRATMDINFVVDKAHKKANPASKDADLHFAGRSLEVGLPMVSELMNAKKRQDLIDRIHEVEGTNQKLAITGVWRLWCEHAGSQTQDQGADVDPAETTNPDHVFEIHPVTRLDGKSALDTFAPITGFTYKDAATAFHAYENVRCRIAEVQGEDKISLTTGMAGFNYVEFKLKPDGAIHDIADGCQVFASVFETDAEDEDDSEGLLVRKRRMVFVKGTAAEAAIRSLPNGKMLQVVGIPRINLSLVDWRVRKSATDPSVLDWNVPYEIVVVAATGGAAGAVAASAELNEEAPRRAAMRAPREAARPLDASGGMSEETLRRIIREEILRLQQAPAGGAAKKSETKSGGGDDELIEEKAPAKKKKGQPKKGPDADLKGPK